MRSHELFRAEQKTDLIGLVNQLGIEYKLPQHIIEYAKSVADLAFEKRLHAATKYNILAVAALYYASKTTSDCQAFGLYEFSSKSGIKKKDLSHLYKKLMLFLEEKPAACSFDPKVWLTKLCEVFQDQIDETKKANMFSLLDKIKTNNVLKCTCISPRCLAGAIFYAYGHYVYGQGGVSREKIARTLGVAPQTVTRYEFLIIDSGVLHGS